MNDVIKKDFIQDFGEAYHMFGLPRLMGRIVGLLLHADEPVSLDFITNELNVSKGPVSQIIKRLRDHNQVKRVWIPGDRKDYYIADPDIFEHSFQHHMKMMEQNLKLAKKYHKLIKNNHYKGSDAFKKHIFEMESFFDNVKNHYSYLLDEWNKKKLK
jgi:DNA-binding transcriptional regulator GbsR (MarR family)